MTAHPNRTGIVFLGEGYDIGEPGEFGTFYSGWFSGYHDTGPGAVAYERIDDVSLGEGLRWALERADDVRVRVGDEMFFAGTVPVEGMPALPDGLVVERRRPAGEEWRDRGDAAPPIGWHVDVELTLPRQTPEPDWDAVFVERTARAGAIEWTTRRIIPVGIRPNQGWFARGMEIDGFAVLSDRDLGRSHGLAPVHHTAYRLTFTLDAPNAERAMRDAVERIGLPADWRLLARARPL